MARARSPVTAAVRALRKLGVSYTEHLYRYSDHPGALGGAEALGLDPHAVVKTLVMEDDRGDPLVVLMHGDREVSTKQLARQLERKSIRPCAPEVAQRHSGYVVGGTSPFGLRKPMPVYLQSTVATLATVYVNGGKRGFLLGMAAEDLIEGLHPVVVDAATS